MFYSHLINDVIIANAFFGKEEATKLAKVTRNIVILDIDLETHINKVEEDISFNKIHFFRGDASDYIFVQIYLG